jgi:pimeloyl-ACP methyl ester carboxylesterase
MSFFKTKDNSNIYFEISGKGLPLVFIHGFSLDHTMWNEQVPFFSKYFQVITIDLRGFGKSSLPTKTYSHHEDIYQLLISLNIPKCSLVGLSLGGEVAIDFAITYPSFVNSLILLDTSLGGYSSKVDWNVHAKEVGVDKAKVNWMNHEVFKYLSKNIEIKEKLEKIVKGYSGWHWLNKDPREKLIPAAIEQLEKITAQTLILYGDNDLQYYKDIASIINEKVPNALIVEVKEASHLVNIEKPNEVNDLIFKFLNSNEPLPNT